MTHLKRFLLPLALVFSLTGLLVAPQVALWVQATVNEVTARNDYTGNGSTTAFTYSFRILTKTDIEVLVDGTVKTVDTDYTVSGLGASGGGTVTFTTAPANLTKIALLRKQAASQVSDYLPNEAFPAERIEKDLDKLQMQVQQLREMLQRRPELQKHSLLKDLIIPEGSSATNRAKKYLRWNGAGTGFEIVTGQADLVGVLDDVIPSSTFASLPAAGTAGRLARVTGTNHVYFDNGTAWIPIETLEAYTLAGLPAAGTVGRLAWVTDGNPVGPYRDNGTAWVADSSVALPSYTLAGLPTAGTAGRLARVTNGVSPNAVALDDGNSWNWLIEKSLKSNVVGSPEFGTIQSAVNGLPAAGGTAIVPSGTYVEQVTITKSNVTLLLAPDAVLAPTAAGAALTIGDGTSAIYSNIRIFGGQIKPSGASPTRGIYLRGGSSGGGLQRIYIETEVNGADATNAAFDGIFGDAAAGTFSGLDRVIFGPYNSVVNCLRDGYSFQSPAIHNMNEIRVYGRGNNNSRYGLYGTLITGLHFIGNELATQSNVATTRALRYEGINGGSVIGATLRSNVLVAVGNVVTAEFVNNGATNTSGISVSGVYIDGDPASSAGRVQITTSNGIAFTGTAFVSLASGAAVRTSGTVSNISNVSNVNFSIDDATKLADHSRLISTQRTSTGSVAGSGEALVTLTWNTAFPDANYTVNAIVEETTTERNLIAWKIEERLAASIKVRVFNNSVTARTGTIHAYAIHD